MPFQRSRLSAMKKHFVPVVFSVTARLWEAINVEEMRKHLLHRTLLYTKLVTAYQKIFALAHNRVKNNRAITWSVFYTVATWITCVTAHASRRRTRITARAWPDRVINRCPYMVICGKNSLTQGVTRSLTHPHFAGTLSAIVLDATAFRTIKMAGPRSNRAER